MRINTAKTKTLRHTCCWRRIFDIVLHPLMMPTYVVITFFTLLFPYSIHSESTMLLIPLYLIATFLAPMLISAFAMRKMKQKDLWRPRTSEGSILVIMFCLIFYATSLLFYRNFFFLPFMEAPIIIAIALILCRLFSMSRQVIDMHSAAISATIVYIYYFCLKLGLSLSPTIYLLLVLGGILAFLAIESHRATPRSILFGALTGCIASLACSLIFQ